MMTRQRRGRRGRKWSNSMLLAHQLLRLEHMVLRVTRVREHKVLGFRVWGHKGLLLLEHLVLVLAKAKHWVGRATSTHSGTWGTWGTRLTMQCSPGCQWGRAREKCGGPGRPKVGKTGTSNLQDLSADRTGWVQLPMCTHIVQCLRADWRITWQCTNSWAMTQSFLREMECIAFWSQWVANPFDGKRKSLWWQHWQLCLSSHIGCTNSVFDLLCVKIDIYIYI